MSPVLSLLAAASASTLVGTVLARPTSLALTATSLTRRASCSGSQTSCHTSGNVDGCCVNTPGGLLLQTQFWDTNPSTGPDDSWTIHGLWPDNCDATYDSNCDPKREYKNISDILSGGGASDILDYMNKYWLDQNGDNEQFWEHEWGKHGTCISTLDPDCYDNYKSGQEAVDFFTTAVNLFKTVNTYKFLSDNGITPDSSKTYSLSDINDAAKKGWGKSVTPLFNCNGNTLDEVWYFHNTKGTIADGVDAFVPVDAQGDSSCPSSGIKYPPKSGGGSGGGGGGGGGGSGGAPTDGSKGNLNVVSGGSDKGCILSAGTWSVQTCASFTASSSGDGFSLKGSKGSCGVSGGSLSCSGDSSTAFTFGDDGTMSASGSSKFYANSVPSGQDQETVYTSSKSQSISLVWTST